jgi:hypothetical protein
MVEVSEVLEMARVCWRGLVRFGNMQYSSHWWNWEPRDAENR